MRSLPLLFLAALSGVAFGAIKNPVITSEESFFRILNDVSSGKDYAGTTVYLGKDLDFSSYPPLTTPIGVNESLPFSGTFNGRGYVISGLSVNLTGSTIFKVMYSNYMYGGLFGFVENGTITEVVLDDSCSVTVAEGNYDNTFISIGGIVGYFENTTVKNCVNMASLSFNGRSSFFYAGGIIGYFTRSGTIINCANYGPITVSGNGLSEVALGGIVGYPAEFYFDPLSYVINCGNYGDITANVKYVNYYFIGGIIGYANTNIHIENCMSDGEIINTSQSNFTSHIGSIVGSLRAFRYYQMSYFINNIWTINVEVDVEYGANYSRVESTGSKKYDMGSKYTIVSELNKLPQENSTYTYWLALSGINGYFGTGFSSIVTTGRIFPKPVREGYIFSYWSMDAEGTERYDHFTNQIDGSFTTLTAIYTAIVTVTLDFGDETRVMKVPYGEKYGRLPRGVKTGHSFIGWFTAEDVEVTENTTVTTKVKHTLYAHWIPNNYTVTFVFGNGDEIELKTFTFGSAIAYPEDPVRDEYTFDGWEPNPETMPADDITIRAKWDSDNLTVTFDAGELEATQKSKVVVYKKAYGELPGVVGEKAGLSFAGWFTEEGGQGERVTEETTVPTKADHTLYAHWAPNSYAVTFVLENGDKPEVRTFKYNETIAYPENVTKEGYKLDGWAPMPERMGAANISVTALWSIGSYAVTFVFGNDDEPEVRVYEYNETVEYPSNVSERTGYIFNGWDKDVERMPGHNITVTAKWNYIKYTIKFIFNNGQEPEARLLTPYEPIDYPENVVREGYVFDGWYPKPEVMPEKNISVVAQWVESGIAESSSAGIAGEGVLVEVVLDKNAKYEEVAELVKDFTEEKFEVESFEVDKNTGDIKVTLKFQDEKAAEGFVESVNEKAGEGSPIKEASLCTSKGSLAAALCPAALVGLLVMLF